MKIDFCGGTYKTFSPIINAEECVNFLPVIDKGRRVLRGTPGLKELVDTEEYAEVRDEKRMGRYLYSVVGNKVFRIDNNWSKTQCTGDELTTNTGKVSLDVNNSNQLMIVDGVYGYIVQGTVISKIEDEDFPANPTSVTHLDGYFVVTFQNVGRCNISDLNDGSSWDSTMYFNAESKPDDSECAFTSHREVLIFGGNSIEPWYNSGDTVPLDRSPGTQEIGIGARHSPAILDNTVFFLTNTLQIARLEGMNPVVVSTPAIDYLIAQYSKADDAIGMGMTIEGNPLYILTFPTANATLCYNARFNEFNQLMSFPSPYTNRWRGNCYEYFNGKHIVGDYQNGKLYEWDFGTYTDNVETIRRRRIAPAIFDENGRMIFHHELEVFFEMGVGLSTGQGSDPQVMLRWLDNGKEWSNEHWESIGKMGDYDNTTNWHCLGSSRRRNYEITITDPVKCVIEGAKLRATVGM